MEGARDRRSLSVSDAQFVVNKEIVIYLGCEFEQIAMRERRPSMKGRSPTMTSEAMLEVICIDPFVSLDWNGIMIANKVGWMYS